MGKKTRRRRERKTGEDSLVQPSPSANTGSSELQEVKARLEEIALATASLREAQATEREVKAARRKEKAQAAGLQRHTETLRAKQAEKEEWIRLQSELVEFEASRIEAAANRRTREVQSRNMRLISIAAIVLTIGICVAAAFVPVLIGPAVSLAVAAVTGVGIIMKDEAKKMRLKNERLNLLAELKKLEILEKSIIAVSKSLNENVKTKTGTTLIGDAKDIRVYTGGLEENTTGLAGVARSIGSSIISSISSLVSGAEKEAKSQVKDSEEINAITRHVNLLCRRLKIPNNQEFDIEAHIKEREGVLHACIAASQVERSGQLKAYDASLKLTSHPSITTALESFVEGKVRGSDTASHHRAVSPSHHSNHSQGAHTKSQRGGAL